MIIMEASYSVMKSHMWCHGVCSQKKKKRAEKKVENESYCTAACWMSPIKGLNESHGKTKLKLASTSHQSWLHSSWVATWASKKHHMKKMRNGSHTRLNFRTHFHPFPQNKNQSLYTTRIHYHLHPSKSRDDGKCAYYHPIQQRWRHIW
jgi:hypothetical protein